MKNLVIILVVVLIAAGAFFALKGPDLTPIESDYLDFKVGTKYGPDMKVTEELDKFKTKSEVYYSISSKKPFEAEASVEVTVKNVADMANVVLTEKLATFDKKVFRPINPIPADKVGKFVIELVKDGAVIARKVFTISDDVQAPAAPAPAAPAAPTTPVAPATGEVQPK